MASVISYELWQSKLGNPSGIATLDGAGKVLDSQLKLGTSNGIATLDGAGKVLDSELKLGIPNGISALDSSGKVLDSQLKLGIPNGIPTLDGTGKIPASQLPPQVVQTYKGQYATSGNLPSTGTLADYAYVDATSSYWYWNARLAPAAWVNQQIAELAYNALTPVAKAAVPYIVMP